MGDLSVLAGSTILRGGVGECQPCRRNWSLSGPWHFVQLAAGERDPERALLGYEQYGERDRRGFDVGAVSGGSVAAPALLEFNADRVVAVLIDVLDGMRSSGSIQRTRTPGGDSKRSWDSNRRASPA